MPMPPNLQSQVQGFDTFSQRFPSLSPGTAGGNQWGVSASYSTNMLPGPEQTQFTPTTPPSASRPPSLVSDMKSELSSPSTKWADDVSSAYGQRDFSSPVAGYSQAWEQTGDFFPQQTAMMGYNFWDRRYIQMTSSPVHVSQQVGYDFGTMQTMPNMHQQVDQSGSFSKDDRSDSGSNKNQSRPQVPANQQREKEDRILMEGKRMGLTYKEIKKRMETRVAESTLRGRFRALTKRREERVRKPVWTPKDVCTLFSPSGTVLLTFGSSNSSMRS